MANSRSTDTRSTKYAIASTLLAHTVAVAVLSNARSRYAQPLRMWLRVSLRRNPFLVPIPTEKLALGGVLASQPGQHAFSEDKQGFFSVGGSYPRATTRDMHEWDPAPSTLRVGGSAIADGDMVRIRGAAAVIAQEEALHGR